MLLWWIDAIKNVFGYNSYAYLSLVISISINVHPNLCAKHSNPSPEWSVNKISLFVKLNNLDNVSFIPLFLYISFVYKSYLYSIHDIE